MRLRDEGIKKLLQCFFLLLLMISSLTVLTLDTKSLVNTTLIYAFENQYTIVKPNVPSLPLPDIQAVPARGKLLIASKNLQNTWFQETVIFLVEYNASGAMGLIINKPSTIRLADLITDLPALKKRKDVAFFGGPVEGNRMFLLIRSMNDIEESFKVMEDVHMSTSRAVFEQVVSGKLKATFRSFAGYSGWAAGQLDAEIARGDWYVTKASAKIIFEHNSDTLWQELISSSTAIQV